MSDFNTSYDVTMGHEGAYSNNPMDKGGETYKGVSRVYYPQWEGWIIIDNLKNSSNFPYILNNSDVLNTMIKRFYKQNYWDKFWGDKITNQQIADELFDTSVNMGINRSIKYLQIGLNKLNRNQHDYPDIVEDGIFGMNTLNVLNTYLDQNNSDLLFKIMNILQGMHYINYMSESPSQEIFTRGWLSRVTFIKH